jgi:CRP-like cAMP-binding protein
MEQAGVPPVGGAAPALQIVRGLPLFDGASEGFLERVVGIARTRSYAAGEVVFRKDDPSDSLLILNAGRIVVSSLSAEGNEVMLNLIHPGEVVGEIGLLDGGPRSATAIAEQETRALVLYRREFLPLLVSEPSAVRALLLVLCARVRQVTAFLEDAVLQPLPVRLLHRVQALARRYGAPLNGGGVYIEHGLSQQELGDSIGTSRVSVNKQLNAWRARALLDFGRGFIVIHDMARLESGVRDE